MEAYTSETLYSVYRPNMPIHDIGRAETSLMLLLPTLFTAAAALAVGLFASMPYSPLEWARLIATRQYTP